MPEELRTILKDTLSEHGMTDWFYAANRYLEWDYPVHAWVKGRQELVLEAARAYTEGVYI